jgi:hypothetical protein
MDDPSVSQPPTNTLDQRVALEQPRDLRRQDGSMKRSAPVKQTEFRRPKKCKDNHDDILTQATNEVHLFCVRIPDFQQLIS